MKLHRDIIDTARIPSVWDPDHLSYYIEPFTVQEKNGLLVAASGLATSGVVAIRNDLFKEIVEEIATADEQVISLPFVMGEKKRIDASEEELKVLGELEVRAREHSEEYAALMNDRVRIIQEQTFLYAVYGLKRIEQVLPKDALQEVEPGFEPYTTFKPWDQDPERMVEVLDLSDADYERRVDIINSLGPDYKPVSEKAEEFYSLSEEKTKNSDSSSSVDSDPNSSVTGDESNPTKQD